MNDLNIASIVNDLQVLATSPEALLGYSWLGLALVLLLLVWLAFRLLKVIRDFNESEMIRKARGRPPEKAESISKRIEELKNHASGGMRSAFLRSLGLIGIGIVAPGILLIIIVAFDHWFLPGAPSLLEGETVISGSGVEPFSLTVFVIDQALRGALTDTFEVFGIGLSGLSNNPDNLVFSGLILAYRSLCGIVLIAILLLLWRVLSALPNLHQAIAAYEDALAKAEGNG
jgi:hypothetical protein